MSVQREAGCGRAGANLWGKVPRDKLLGTGRKESSTMAHKVTEGCIGCGACEGACPVGAVKVEDGVAVVDAGACIDCGACEGACPTGAIVAE